jgi:hypothetical protein
MGAIRLYQEMWPLVFWVFDGTQTDADMDYYFAGLDELHRRKELFGTVSLMKKFQSNRTHLMRIAEWIKANKEATGTLNVASGMVSTSALFRFTLSSLFLVQPMLVPYRVFPTQAESVTWVGEHLLKRGLKLPTGFEKFVPA